MKNLLFYLAISVIIASLLFCTDARAITCTYNVTHCDVGGEPQITTPGFWCLNTSILNGNVDPCLTIFSENVTLNGLANLGIYLDGTGSRTAISIASNNITITNMNLTQWNYAIETSQNLTTITNVNLSFMTQSIRIQGIGSSGHNATITNLNITNATDTGIWISGSNFNNVTNNTIVSNNGEYGLSFYQSDHNYIQRNTLKTLDYTLTLTNSNYNYIDANNITQSNLGGFNLVGSSYNNLTNNEVYQPNQSAFEITGNSNYNIFWRNNITNASQHGFNVGYSVGNNLTSNIVRDVNQTGFNLMGINDSTIALNLITNVSQCGLKIYDSLNVNITNNTFQNPTTNQAGSFGFEIKNVNDSSISYNNMTNLTYKGFIVNLSNNNMLLDNNYTTRFISEGFVFLGLENSYNNQIAGMYFISILGLSAQSSCSPLISFLNSSYNNLSNVIAQSIWASNRGIVFFTNSNYNILRNMTLSNDACPTFNLSNASHNKILDSTSDLYANFSMGNSNLHTTYKSGGGSTSNEIHFLRMRLYGDINSTPVNLSAYGDDFGISPTKYPPNAPKNISYFFNVTKNLGGLETLLLRINYNESLLGYFKESTIRINYSRPTFPEEWAYLTNQQLYANQDYINGTVGDLMTINDSYFGLFADYDFPPSVHLSYPTNGKLIDTNIFNFTATDNESLTMNCSIYLNNTYNQSNSSTLNNTITTFIVPWRANGFYSWNVSCNDGINTNWSETWTFLINRDSVPPVPVQGTNPINNYNDTDGNITFEFRCYDNINVTVIQLWTNTTGIWHANYTNSNYSYVNNTQLNITVPGIPESRNYKWAVTCMDNSSNNATTTNRTFGVDKTAPTINLIPPTPDNGTQQEDRSIIINASINDSNPGRIWLNWNNTPEQNQTWTNGYIAIQKNNIPNGNYTYNITITDIAGNSNTSETRWINISATAPNVELILPEDNNISNVNWNNFTCNATSFNGKTLKNITLYWNNSGIWQANDTINTTADPSHIQVGFNETVVNKTIIWNCLAYDNGSESAWSTQNYTFIEDMTPPKTYLNYPENGNLTNSTTVLFNCSATDENLSNITLYENWSGAWHANETESISGASGSSIFTKILQAGQDYFWNCQACDNFNQCSNASQNYFFTIDTNYPQLTLVYPDDGHNFNSDTSAIVFKWNISDDLAPSINCTVYTKGAYQSQKVCDNESTCEQTIAFSYGDYTWQVNCSDGINQNISEIRSFSIDRPTEGERGGGGGGGGTGGSCGDGACNRSSAAYTFNCSASGYSHLYNVSLFGNWGSGWHIEELKNVEGQNIEVSFAKTFSISGDYIWNCYVCGRLPSGYLKCSFIMANKTASIITTGGDETKENCCRDCGCPSGQSCVNNACDIIVTCGNGFCDAGETTDNCCTDCRCPSGQICAGGGCTSLSYCGDQVCDASIGETLDNCPLDCIFSAISCGDGYCDRASESVDACPQDCSPVCGNKVCEGNETQSTCCRDCGCASGQDCSNNKCSGKGLNLSGFWNFTKKALLPIIIIILAALIAFGIYLYIRKYKEKSLIQVMIEIGKEIEKKKVNEMQARIRKEHANLTTENKKIRENIDAGMKICQELLKESIEKGDISAVAELLETKKKLLKNISVLFDKYIDILKEERSPFEQNLREIILSEEVPLYERLKKEIAHLYNVGRKIRMAKSPMNIG